MDSAGYHLTKLEGILDKSTQEQDRLILQIAELRSRIDRAVTVLGSENDYTEAVYDAHEILLGR